MANGQLRRELLPRRKPQLLALPDDTSPTSTDPNGQASSSKSSLGSPHEHATGQTFLYTKTAHYAVFVYKNGRVKPRRLACKAQEPLRVVLLGGFARPPLHLRRRPPPSIFLSPEPGRLDVRLAGMAKTKASNVEGRGSLATSKSRFHPRERWATVLGCFHLYAGDRGHTKSTLARCCRAYYRAPRNPRRVRMGR